MNFKNHLIHIQTEWFFKKRSNPSDYGVAEIDEKEFYLLSKNHGILKPN